MVVFLITVPRHLTDLQQLPTMLQNACIVLKIRSAPSFPRPSTTWAESYALIATNLEENNNLQYK